MLHWICQPIGAMRLASGMTSSAPTGLPRPNCTRTPRTPAALSVFSSASVTLELTTQTARQFSPSCSSTSSTHRCRCHRWKAAPSHCGWCPASSAAPVVGHRRVRRLEYRLGIIGKARIIDVVMAIGGAVRHREGHARVFGQGGRGGQRQAGNHSTTIKRIISSPYSHSHTVWPTSSATSRLPSLATVIPQDGPRPWADFSTRHPRNR